MKQYRVNQIISGISYEGTRLFNHKWEAEREAESRTEADRFTGEYRTTYEVVEV